MRAEASKIDTKKRINVAVFIDWPDGEQLVNEVTCIGSGDPVGAAARRLREIADQLEAA